MSRSSLISGIFLLGAVLIALVYVRPAWQEFQTLKRSNQGLYEIQGEVDLLLQESGENIDALNALSQEDLSRAAYALPSADQLFNFLITLETLSIKHGVRFKRVDVVPPAAEQKVAPGIPPRVPQTLKEERGLSSAAPAPLAQPRPGTLPVGMIAKGSSKELLVQLTVVGPYEMIKSFLRDLERNLRITDVYELSFVSPPKATDLFEVVTKLRAYYQ